VYCPVLATTVTVVRLPVLWTIFVEALFLAGFSRVEIFVLSGVAAKAH
jgi:hypothetical protein